jgi:hypothetical protein
MLLERLLMADLFDAVVRGHVTGRPKMDHVEIVLKGVEMAGLGKTE